MERPGQIAAQHFYLTAGELGRQVQERAAAFVDEAHRAATGLYAAEAGEQAHAFQHGQMRFAAEVDGLTALAQGRGQFDDGGLEAVASQPVGQRRAGDARAGDEDVPVHVVPSTR